MGKNKKSQALPIIFVISGAIIGLGTIIPAIIFPQMIAGYGTPNETIIQLLGVGFAITWIGWGGHEIINQE
jgi:hypothetical protein